MHALVGVACQTIDQKGVLRLFDSLTAAQAKSVLTRLEMIDRQTYPLSKTFEEEKRCGQGQMLEIFRLIRSYKDVVELNDLSSGNPIDNNEKVLEYVLMDKRGVVDQYTKYMDSIIAISKQSHYVHSSMPVVPKDPINQLLDSDPSVLSSCIYSSISLTTTHKLLIVGLALKIYKDVHGKYPDRLSQLVPGILAKLPDDNFVLSGTFKYRSGKDKYVLYSVGPDGNDDGGVPIDDKSKISKQFPSSTSRYVPREDSKGDIILGTNVR